MKVAIIRNDSDLFDGLNEITGIILEQGKKLKKLEIASVRIKNLFRIQEPLG
jgi:hypothetical protein